MSQYEFVLTFFSTVVTILAIIMAILAYFNWSNIEQKVRSQVEVYAKREIEKTKERLNKVNQAYTQYLLLIQSENDPELYKEEACRLMKANGDLWNVWVYGAIKYLEPLLKELVKFGSMVSPDELQRQDITDAIKLLNIGKGKHRIHNLSEVHLWLAVGYALLSEPCSSLMNVQRIDDQRVVKRILKWLDLFWSMSAQPADGKMFSLLTAHFSVGPLLSHENTCILVDEIDATPKWRLSLDHFSRGVWFLGSEKVNGRASAVGLIKVNGGEVSYTVNYQEHYSRSNGWSMPSKEVSSFIRCRRIHDGEIYGSCSCAQ
jgi:hypothetical protein